MKTENTDSVAISSGVELVKQMRQLSIPMWARILTLTVCLAVLIGGILIIFVGVAGSYGNERGDVIDIGGRLLGIALIPSLLLMYLTFAQTGVKALLRKTNSLLDETVPETLALPVSQHDIQSSCFFEHRVATNHETDSPTSNYWITASAASGDVVIGLKVEINVSKVNVVVCVPLSNTHRCDANVSDQFDEAISGARKEGYDVTATVSQIRGSSFLEIIGRKKFSDEFLWDSAQKLYFAQDLRLFVMAIMRKALALNASP